MASLPTTLPGPLPVDSSLRAWPGKYADKVAEITGALPEGAKGIVVAQTSLVGVRLGAMMRVKGGFTFVGYVGYRFFESKPDLGVELRWVGF